MQITVLTENNARIDNYLLAEPALSLLIEFDDKKILFDTGYSDVFLKNANALNINLNDITDIVLSHGHNDHTGGLQYFNPLKTNIKLTAHPNIFDKKFEPDGTSYGCPVTKEFLQEKFILNLIKEPYFLSKNILFLGEIEGNNSSDVDDSALACIVRNKLFIITGCSHCGIINIINYAKQVTGIEKIYGVLGGLHLLNTPKNKLSEISQFFAKEKMEYIAPCHCCDLNSKIALSQHNKIEEICTGDKIILNI